MRFSPGGVAMRHTQPAHRTGAADIESNPAALAGPLPDGHDIVITTRHEGLSINYSALLRDGKQIFSKAVRSPCATPVRRAQEP